MQEQKRFSTTSYMVFLNLTPILQEKDFDEENLKGLIESRKDQIEVLKESLQKFINKEKYSFDVENQFWYFNVGFTADLTSEQVELLNNDPEVDHLERNISMQENRFNKVNLFSRGIIRVPQYITIHI